MEFEEPMNHTGKKTEKTIYDFPKNCKHNKSGWCHLCVIKEISAAREEERKRVIKNIKTLKKNYKCGACDNKDDNDLHHTMCCRAFDNLFELLKGE